MRGLLMALYAVDLPGHAAASNLACLRSTKTPAKKTTTKTV